MRPARRKALWLGVIGMACGLQAADAPSVRFLTLATRDYLTQQIGKYDPALKHPWVRNDTYLERPLQGTVYTIFGLTGKLAEAQTIDLQRLDRDALAWAWYAHISRWPWKLQEQALAMQGSWPDPTRVAQPLPTDDSASIQSVSDFLKKKKLNVPQPFITQAFAIDLLGDGHEEHILCAHSDASALTDNSEAMIYAVVLMTFEQDGKTIVLPIDSYTAYKPAHRSIENQEKLYDRRPFYRLIAFPDIQGDGHLEIAYTRNLEFLPATLIATFDGKVVKKVLESYILE